MFAWFLYSILAAFLWAGTNVVDKVALTRWVKSPLIPLLSTAVVGVLAAVAVGFLHGWGSLSPTGWALALLLSIAYNGLYYFYFRAAALDEITRVVSLFYLSPLLVLVFAALFLGEVFTPLRYLGIVLLVIGAVLISLRDVRSFSFGRATPFILLGLTCDAVYIILAKYFLNSADVWSVFIYPRLISGVLMIPLLCLYGRKVQAFAKLKPKHLVVIASNQAVEAAGAFLLLLALSTGFASLANALTTVQSFFVFVLASLASVFFPKVIREELSPTVLVMKAVAILIIIAGAILVS